MEAPGPRTYWRDYVYWFVLGTPFGTPEKPMEVAEDRVVLASLDSGPVTRTLDKWLRTRYKLLTMTFDNTR